MRVRTGGDAVGLEKGGHIALESLVERGQPAVRSVQRAVRMARQSLAQDARSQLALAFEGLVVVAMLSRLEWRLLYAVGNARRLVLRALAEPPDCLAHRRLSLLHDLYDVLVAQDVLLPAPLRRVP